MVLRNCKSCMPETTTTACTTRVLSDERCQQPPEWAVLSHIKCLSQCEVVGFQLILYSLAPCDTRTVFSGRLEEAQMESS